MPRYVKFMKEILFKKKRLGYFETVALTKECSTIIQKKLPPKLKDLGSFTILCTIGNQFFGKALCDLGASINLMLLSIYRRLRLMEAKPNVTLQLADRSLTYPRGVVEDVFVKVDKFKFPADLIVLDMEEDWEIPIILGRPFLATGRTLIDVQKGELTMRVQDQEITFNVFKAMKFPDDFEGYFRVDLVDGCVDYAFLEDYPVDHLENSIVNSSLVEKPNSFKFLYLLDASPHFHRVKQFETLEFPTNDNSHVKLSIEVPPTLELKPLPNHLWYAFLGESSTLPIVISASLNDEQEDKLLRVLREHKQALWWSIVDVRGMRPSICMQRFF